MKLITCSFARSFALAGALTLTASVYAGDITTAADSSSTSSSPDTRYGLFNWLDHRSAYGQGVYPEPFLVDDSDLEVNEFRLDWLHTKADQLKTDAFTTEIEKGFGNLTLELELHYERDHDSATGITGEGFQNVDLGARYPVYEYVSASGVIDSTFGVAAEAGIPTNSPLGKNTEFVPKVFNDLRLGSHFTMQSIVGCSMLYGPGDEGGLDTFEYGFVFGWTIPRQELPIPGVQQLIPVLELSGETGLNKGESGQNSLLGNAGFRVNMNTIGPIQPRLGVGFVFPIDNGAREETHWGVVTSLVFEY